MSRQHIRKASNDFDSIHVDEEEMAELVVVYLSVYAFDTAFRSDAIQERFDASRLKSLEDHLDGISRRLRQWNRRMRAGMHQYIRSLAVDLRMKTKFKRSQRGRGKHKVSRRAGEFLDMFLNRAQSKKGKLREIFHGKAFRKIRRCSHAVQEDNPSGILHKLAMIPLRVSPIKKASGWIERAAELLEVEPSDMERSAKAVERVEELADEVRDLDTRLNGVSPSSQVYTEMLEQKRELMDDIESIVEASEHPESVRGAALEGISRDHEGHTTEIGKQLSMTPEQEQAMLSEGRSIIAAGAGSGKTRVLAGKVVYHMEEKGDDPEEIIACSFSRKSSHELEERIDEYGGNLKKRSGFEKDGFGTTHSIALDLLDRYSDRRKQKPIMGWEKSKLIRLAMRQVKMRPSGGEIPEVPEEDKTFFPEEDRRTLEEDESGEPSERVERLNRAFDAVEDFVTYLVDRYEDGRVPPNSWKEEALEVIREFRGTDPAEMSAKEKRLVDKILGHPVQKSLDENDDRVRDPRGGTLRKLRRWGLPGYQVSDKDYSAQTDDPGYEDWTTKESARRPISRRMIEAGDDKGDVDLDGVDKLNDKKMSQLEDDYPFFYKNPADKWFNLGADDSDFEREMGDLKTQIPVGEFSLYISQRKGNLEAPGAAMESSGDLPESLEQAPRPHEQDFEEGGAQKDDIFAAVYGAYEWLKDNIDDFSKRQDFDDMLIDASKMMVNHPEARKKIQNRFNTVLVDEAQDQNASQHLMFGLVTGSYDPETLEPIGDDEEMASETYCLIGDDKQSIYEFRGADPEQFVQKSDRTEGGENFETNILEVNFRSGSNIVEAANQLISHNDDQIPMECRSYETKGEGHIEAREFETNQDCARHVAERINELTSFEESGISADDFGIAVRTNREASSHALEMIKENIPFRGYNPFRNQVIDPIISLLRFAKASDTATINESITAGVDTPDFNISPYTLEKRLDQYTKEGENYFTFLKEGGWRKIYYDDWRNEDFVRPYVDYLEKLRDRADSLSTSGLINFIVRYEGPLGTVRDSLVQDVLEDEDALEAVANEYGEVTETTLEEYAMGPIDPLKAVAQNNPDLESALDYIDILMERNQSLQKGDDPNDADFDEPAVTIDTVHGWKGLETEHLYVPMYESETGGFPHPKNRSEEGINSERRLAYVALTRGEESVTVLRPKIDPASQEPTRRSRFVDEACIPVEDETQEREIEASQSESRHASSWSDATLNAYLRGDLEAARAHRRFDEAKSTS